MTDYRVHALTETSHLMPDGDVYAPQIALTWDRYNVNTTALNGDMLPLSADAIASAFAAFNHDVELTARWMRIVTSCEVVTLKTLGYSQGDVCISFAIATPEWLTLTGAESITPQDCQDLASWVWGDVYEVSYRDDVHEDENWLVYGMDAAMEYGDIVFPTYATITSYED